MTRSVYRQVNRRFDTSPADFRKWLAASATLSTLKTKFNGTLDRLSQVRFLDPNQLAVC